MTAQIAFERPFKYVMKDPNWTKKVLIGGLISLSCIVFVGIFVLAGYAKKVFLTLVKDEDAPIPEIEFGKDLSEGLGVVGVMVCYYAIVLVIAVIPILGWILSPILSLALGFVLPVGLMRYFATGQFGAAFDYKGILEYTKANLNNLLLLFVINLILGFIGSLGGIACGVGALFTGFWALIARSAAMADVWRASQQPIAALPPGTPTRNDVAPAP